MKVTLSFGQRRYLLMLADRGRKVRMYLTEKAIGPDARKGIFAMEPMALIKTTPLVGTDESEVELTDLGAQVVSQMKERFAHEVYTAREDGSGAVGCPDCDQCMVCRSGYCCRAQGGAT